MNNKVMIFAKYIRSNTPFEEEGLTRGLVYEVKRIDKESHRVYLEGFENTYCTVCFEFYNGTIIKI